MEVQKPKTVKTAVFSYFLVLSYLLWSSAVALIEITFKPPEPEFQIGQAAVVLGFMAILGWTGYLNSRLYSGEPRARKTFLMVLAIFIVMIVPAAFLRLLHLLRCGYIDIGATATLMLEVGYPIVLTLLLYSKSSNVWFQCANKKSTNETLSI
jgi:hypothetical protein